LEMCHNLSKVPGVVPIRTGRHLDVFDTDKQNALNGMESGEGTMETGTLGYDNQVRHTRIMH